MMASEKELRDRIDTVKKTNKITEAMRLVAAAKVRKAQQAVLATRPFAETLQSVFKGLMTRVEGEDLDLPLLDKREVKKVTLVVMTGDRGLCGAYNSFGIKKAEARIKELSAQGISVNVVCVGKKVAQFYGRRDVEVLGTFNMGQAPTASEARAVCDLILNSFVAGETDTVEMIYTRFVSLIASEPSILTLLPVTPSGIETETDELFTLSSSGSQFSMSKTDADAATEKAFPTDVIFENNPAQVVESLLPLYLTGQVLRMLQESVASELAARMKAMAAASDNASALSKDLSQQYNRMRQAGVTQAMLEIVGGSL